METYTPIIQATLAEWLQLTIDHPLYAAALVIGVWLLTVMFYSVKTSGFNKKFIASEQTRTAAETTLNTAEQQRQQAQEHTLALTEQLEQQQQAANAEKQHALAVEQQNAQRNQQITAIIQRLASSFDIGERPVAVIDNLKADDLWQQHDKVITKLIETLRTEQLAKTELERFYQAEKTKLAETEAKLVSLQANTNDQPDLVLAVQALQQHQNDTKRDLNETLKKHQADLVELLQQERPAAQIITVQPPVSLPVVEPVAIVTEQPRVVIPPVEVAEKPQELFKKPEPAIAPPLEDEITLSPQATAQPASIVVEPEVIPATLAAVIPVEKTPEKPSKNSALKGMYQKFTTSKAEQTTPVVLVAKPEPIKVASVEKTPEKPSKSSALKGMYSKFTTSKTEQPAPVISVVEPEPAPAVEPVPAKVEPITKLAEKPSNVMQPQGLYQKPTATNVQKKDLTPESFDDSSGRLEEVADQITEKLEKMKGLYGKLFSKKE